MRWKDVTLHKNKVGTRLDSNDRQLITIVSCCSQILEMFINSASVLICRMNVQFTKNPACSFVEYLKPPQPLITDLISVQIECQAICWKKIVKLGNNHASEARNHKITVHCFEKNRICFSIVLPDYICLYRFR